MNTLPCHMLEVFLRYQIHNGRGKYFGKSNPLMIKKPHQRSETTRYFLICMTGCLGYSLYAKLKCCSNVLLKESDA